MFKHVQCSTRMQRPGKSQWAFIFSFLLVSFISINVAQAQNYYVATTGNDANNGLAPGTPKLTIQAAITAAPAGATINVGAGTYAGPVQITKTLTVKGANAGTSGSATRVAESIVDGGNTTDCMIVQAASVIIDGFKLQNGGGNNYGGIAVGFFDAYTGVQVLNNIITNNVIGIAQAKSNTLIKRNLFDGNNKTGPSGGAAIYTDVANNGLVIEENEFKNHTANSAVIFGATAANTHQNVTFTKNYAHDNSYAGTEVYCVAINGGTFSQNVITKPGYTAIKLAGACTNIAIQNNTLDNNAVGVRIADDGYNLGSNSNVAIHQNSFANNTNKAIDQQESFLVDATCNWYGTATPTTTQVAGNVTFLPALANGTDSAPTTLGFQTAAACGVVASVSSLTVNGSLGSTPGCTATISGVASGSTFVFTGPNGYVFTNVFRTPGTYNVVATGIKDPGTYTLTVFGDGSLKQTIDVTGTACPQ